MLYVSAQGHLGPRLEKALWPFGVMSWGNRRAMPEKERLQWEGNPDPDGWSRRFLGGGGITVGE